MADAKTTAAPKGRALVSKASKAAKKAAAKPKGGDSTRVAVPTLAHFQGLDAEIAEAQAKAFRTYKPEDFVTLRALYDRGYRWARKLYENSDLIEQSKVATKAAQKAEKDAAKAAEEADASS